MVGSDVFPTELVSLFRGHSFVFSGVIKELIYKDGDPMGHVYVVLNGSVVIHRALQENALATDPGARGGPGGLVGMVGQHVGSFKYFLFSPRKLGNMNPF